MPVKEKIMIKALSKACTVRGNINSAISVDTCKKAPWMEVAWEEYELWNAGNWKESTKLDPSEQQALENELKPIKDKITENKKELAEKTSEIKTIKSKVALLKKTNTNEKNTEEINKLNSQLDTLASEKESLIDEEKKLDQELKQKGKDLDEKYGKGYYRAKKYMDEGGDGNKKLDPTERPWCACFANWVLLETNKRGLGTFSYIPREGNPVWSANFDIITRYKNHKKIAGDKKPYYGCIMVLKKVNSDNDGHVGFVVNYIDELVDEEQSKNKKEALDILEEQIAQKKNEQQSLHREEKQSTNKAEWLILEKKIDVKKEEITKLEAQKKLIENDKSTTNKYKVTIKVQKKTVHLLGGNQSDAVTVQAFYLKKINKRNGVKTDAGAEFYILNYVYPQEYQLCSKHENWYYEYKDSNDYILTKSGKTT